MSYMALLAKAVHRSYINSTPPLLYIMCIITTDGSLRMDICKVKLLTKLPHKRNVPLVF